MPNEFRVKRGLIVESSGSASGSALVTVDGVAGRLFTVVDTFSGSLFSVNTIAGLPVIEAFSDNTVRIGQYGQRALFVSQSRVGIGKETALNALVDVSGSVIITGSLTVTNGINAVFNRVTGSYTFTLADAGRIVEVSGSPSAPSYSLTVPSSSTANFANGSTIDVTLYGTGSILFVTASNNVLLRSANNWVRMGTRYSAATLIKISGEEWYLVGNLNA